MRSLSLLALAACGSAQHAKAPAQEPAAPHVAMPAGPISTATRPAKPSEASLAGFSFDPALDCVAEKIGGTLEPVRYRNVLPIECGSPLHVVEARVTTASDLQATVADMAKRFTDPIPLALGIAQTGERITVVIAARAIELEPYKAGDPTIRGKVLIKVASVKALVSTAHGIAMQDVARDGAAFSLPAPVGDADVELAIVDGKEIGPLGRLRIGKGSPLFAGPGDLLQRLNPTRTSVQLPSVKGATTIGDCGAIPAKVADIEVTDKVACVATPNLALADFADEVHYDPVLQEKLLLPDIAVVEVGEIDGAAAYRVLRKFETLTPEQGRARVMARLREKWPKLVEHATPPGALGAIMDAWAATQPDDTVHDIHPKIVDVAKVWSRQPRYFATLSTARDLDKVIDDIMPAAETPGEVDIAYRQMRDSRGAMRHLVIAVFSLP